LGEASVLVDCCAAGQVGTLILREQQVSVDTEAATGDLNNITRPVYLPGPTARVKIKQNPSNTG
jgi:hypothetical protein